jgi:prepilin peptidase CpaA
LPLYYKILFAMAYSAVVCDLKSERIPNEGICLFWGTGLIFQIITEGFQGLGNGMAGAFLPLMTLAGLFFFRMIGAGDIKLLSALGSVMGPAVVLKCMVLSFFFGALLSAAILIDTKTLIIRLRYFTEYFRNLYTRKSVVPYCKKGKRLENIHFSVPVFMAVMLHMGGFY